MLDRGALLAAAAGGALGTFARYELSLAIPTRPDGFPLATCVVNASGALLIAVVLVTLGARRPSSSRARAFAATGVLGGWTTMSSVAVDVGLLVRDHRGGVAAAYLTVTLVASALGVAGGSALARLGHRHRTTAP